MNSHNKAFSLVEIMIAFTILSVMCIPVYLLFSGSRKMVASAQDISRATILTTNYMTSLRSLNPALFSSPIPQWTPLEEMSTDFQPSSLGLEPLPPQHRILIRIDEYLDEVCDANYAVLNIRLVWSRRFSDVEHRYQLSGLVKL